MKLVIDRSVILKALGHIQSVVEKRGTIPILSNVKLAGEGSTLSLTATDMDIAIVETVAAQVELAGSTTVPAHTFYEIIRKLPDGALVELESTDAGKVSINAGQSSFTLSSLPVADFPVMAEGDFSHNFTLAKAELLALVDKTRFAISTEETRYYLNGIYLHVAGDKDKVLRTVATDGHRLARIEVALPAGAAGIPGVIIPRKTIAELKKLLENEVSEVQVSVSESKIRFVCGNAVLVSKLIDGTFPDYDRVIPSANDKILEVSASLFSSAVDRVSVIASDKSRGVKLKIQKGKLTLSANSPENGTASEDLDVQYGADALEIGFNSRYLLEMMAQIEGETAQFVLADSASPALVRDSADIGALYVVMPMRV
ncbi:MAG: DNA polymerase III subunit beta [Alphaproteobacteria bacterium]|nr:DNA polymerase III subunit beta [Alphaproteobacteria bacterium]